MINAIDEKIKSLRSANKMTQADLARRLNITRASVNAWEMGISKPSIEFIAELARIFNVSTDYLLGMKNNSTINVFGLSVADVELICNLINRLKEQNTK